MLTYTEVAGTTRQKFYFSCIVKIAELTPSGGNPLMHIDDGSTNNRTFLTITAADELFLFDSVGGSTQCHLVSTAKFRDLTSYYFIEYFVDTTQGTAANRVKIFVNGIHITDFSTETYYDQNDNFGGAGVAGRSTQIGGGTGSANSQYYMARVVRTDGDPAGIVTGETTSDGFWQINDASELTFGNNGFLLEGQNLATGADTQATVSDATITNTASVVKDGTSQAAVTYSSVALGTAASDRTIIVGAAGNANVTVNSITVAGVSATFVVRQGGGGIVELWQAAVPSGTSGDIVVTFSGANVRNGIGVWAAYGAGKYLDTASSTADPLTAGGLTIPAGGFGIGFAYNGNTSAATFVGLTEDFDKLVFDAQYFAGGSLAFSSFQDELTVTIDITGTPSQQKGVFASWGPAGLNSFLRVGTITATNDSPTNGDA